MNPDTSGRCDLCGHPAVVERWSKQACEDHADRLNAEVAAINRSFQLQKYLNIGMLVAMIILAIWWFVL